MTGSSTVTSPERRRNPKSSRSLVSRIKAPFSSKQRSPVELEIRLDEPFRQYFAGDTVKGAVRLLTTRASRITHLVIRLHGFVKVVNNVRLPGETIPYDENLLTSMRRRKGIEYFGNGFARLFEDEHILCGDGRVDSEYEFRFELDLPSKGIPSSIDFEHGTISYLLTATLTRPTTISPTLTIHHKLNVTGTIDIADLKPPEPRVVSLKGPSKQKKSKIRPKKRISAMPNGKASLSSSIDGNDVPPQSPAPSTISSGASTRESMTSAHNEVQSVLVEEAASGLEQENTAISPQENTSAKTELLQGGCLPGDMLQLRISVDHREPTKTMQGIIITVFRQGRIDTHPALPLNHSEKGGKSQYEDYYPRSRTGLGGLSLTSAGSSRVFRQDLAQTMMPLIIDPQTLGANIKTSIQMPDHVFPTITCVPGSMISFKYYVEIVIDLRGKHAGQDRFLPHLSITNLPQHSYGDPKISKIDNGDGISYSATPGFNCLITDQLRRTKDVVFTTTEIVVGTKDSTRSRGKRKKSSIDADQGDAEQYEQQDRDESIYMASPLPQPQHAQTSDESPADQHLSDSDRPGSQTPAFPLPELDEPQDEKARIRRAEERLLPSSPPPDHGPPAASIAPTAPFAHDEEDFVQRYGFRARAPSYDGPYSYDLGAEDPLSTQTQYLVSSPASPVTLDSPPANARRLDVQSLEAQREALQNLGDHNAQDETSNHSQNINSNPTPHEAGSVKVSHSPPPDQRTQEDDEDPQQKRLEARTSSPDGVLADEDDASPSAASLPQQPEASAPTLEEVEAAYTPDDHEHEDLPVYRR